MMKLTTLALLVASVGAATVLVTNSAMTGSKSGGWNTTVWQVDTVTGSLQMVADTFADRPAWAGVVCNNVYYTVWAEPLRCGGGCERDWTGASERELRERARA